jgi:hypothetical protein
MLGSNQRSAGSTTRGNTRPSTTTCGWTGWRSGSAIAASSICFTNPTNRTVERGGSFWEYDKGTSLGCPFSPLIGVLFLDELDRRMMETGLFYVRFMDDILVLAPTRWKLRHAVGLVNQILGSRRLQKHPGKTFIGRIERGFVSVSSAVGSVGSRQ